MPKHISNMEEPKIGKLSEIQKEIEVEWRIDDIISGRTKSPSFSFAGASWHLSLDTDYYRGSDELTIGLYQESDDLPISLEFVCGIKISEEKITAKKKFTRFPGNFTFPESCHFERLAELRERKSEQVPFDSLTLVCSLKLLRSKTVPRCEELSHDFKEMMKSGDHSDTTIKVKGEEFRLHRNVLGARNPFFNAMFKTEMRESITGVVTIDDCEPDIFRLFINFIYTGKVKGLTLENVCDLYELADKYQADQVKTDCQQFMINSISVDNFCDIAAMFMKYKELEPLLFNAKLFFCRNRTKIVNSAKWMPFLVKYPAYANDLYSYAFMINEANMEYLQYNIDKLSKKPEIKE